MKIFNLLSILAISLLFSCQKQSDPITVTDEAVEARATVCSPGSVSTGCWPVENVSQTVNYLGCNLVVKYKRQFCFNGGFEITANIWDLQIDYNDPSCNIYVIHILQLLYSGQHHQAVNEQNDLYVYIIKELEGVAVTFMNQIYKIDCDDDNKYYQVSFFLSHCKNWVSKDGKLVESYCGDQCCKSKTRYCVDEEGEIVSQPTEVFSIGGQCDIGPRINGTEVTPCLSPCQMLDFSR